MRQERFSLSEFAIAVVGVISFATSFAIAVALFNGWVLSVMWNWFIPMTFTSAPRLSVGEAIGIALVLSALTNFPPSSQEKKEKTLLEAFIDIISPFLRGLGLLLAGLSLHAMMT